MTALATSADVRDRSAASLAVPVKNAAVTYAGGQGALAAGYAKPFAGAAGEIAAGRFIKDGSVTGNTSATPPPEASLAVEDYVLESVPVAGASAQTDLGKVVFVNSTDNIKTDLTLTRPTRGQPAGIIVRYKSATSFDVLMFGLKTMLANQSVGTREILELGTFANAALITGNIVTGFTMPFRGKFISLHGLVQTAFTGSGGTADVNLEIDTVNVTGGVLTVSTAAGGTIGTILSGTAITAANEFSEGGVLDVEVSGTGGTQTAGSVRLYALVERLPGI